MEYKIGQHVFHSHCGVCYVDDIAPLSGSDASFLYYVLKPLYGDDKGNIVRVPLANPISLMIPLTKKEALQIVKEWPDTSKDLYLKDSKKRKNAYDLSLKRGLIQELAPLLEGAFQRKAKDGHLNSMDALFVARAIPIIYGELSYSLDIPFEDVPQYIIDHAAALELE